MSLPCFKKSFKLALFLTLITLPVNTWASPEEGGLCTATTWVVVPSEGGKCAEGDVLPAGCQGPSQTNTSCSCLRPKEITTKCMPPIHTGSSFVVVRPLY